MILKSDVGNSIQILIFMLPTIVKQDLVPPSPEYAIQIVYSLDKLNANLMMTNLGAETCIDTPCTTLVNTVVF
jgi:hypothetical protein